MLAKLFVPRVHDQWHDCRERHEYGHVEEVDFMIGHATVHAHGQVSPCRRDENGHASHDQDDLRCSADQLLILGRSVPIKKTTYFESF